MKNVIFYRRNLPHIHPRNTIFFITFRLANSLPQYLIKQLKHERKYRFDKIKQLRNKKKINIKKYRTEQIIYMKYDKYLDKCKYGPSWMKNIIISGIIKSKIWQYDGNKYELVSFCIMPNHVHLIISMNGFSPEHCLNHKGPTNKYPLSDILRLLKGGTARMCNQYLNRSGKFWHHESYDHYIRNDEELLRIIKYLENNPIKAGLVDKIDDWPNFFCGI